MAARQSFYVESTGESSTTGAAWADKAVLTFTPDANSDYFFIASATYTAKSTSARGEARLFDSTNAVELGSETRSSLRNSSDYTPYCASGKVSYGASPGSQTVSIQYGLGSSGGTPHYIQNAAIVAIKKGAADQYAESVGTSTASTASFVDTASVTFTPASAGDYLIVATAEYNVGATNKQIEICVDVDGTLISDHQIRADNTTPWFPWATQAKVTLSNASHTIKVKFCEQGGGGTTMSLRQVKLIVLSCGAFDNVYYAESRADQNTTSGTYQTAVTLTTATQAVNHLLLASSLHSVNSGTQQAKARTTEGGSAIMGEMFAGIQAASTTVLITHPYFQLRRETGPGSTTSWTVDYAKVSGAAQTDIYDAAISLLQLDATPVASIQPRLGLTGAGP
jgi:hypothetical protein